MLHQPSPLPLSHPTPLHIPKSCLELLLVGYDKKPRFKKAFRSCGAHRNVGKNIWSAACQKVASCLNQLHPCSWSHSGKRTALAHQIDDLLVGGTLHTIKEVLAELSEDLEIVANENKSKPSKYMEQLDAVSESITNYVENLHDEYNMTPLKRST